MPTFCSRICVKRTCVAHRKPEISFCWLASCRLWRDANFLLKNLCKKTCFFLQYQVLALAFTAWLLCLLNISLLLSKPLWKMWRDANFLLSNLCKAHLHCASQTRNIFSVDLLLVGCDGMPTFCSRICVKRPFFFWKKNTKNQKKKAYRSRLDTGFIPVLYRSWSGIGCIQDLMQTGVRPDFWYYGLTPALYRDGAGVIWVWFRPCLASILV